MSRLYKVGDLVRLKAGGYGGLNYQSLLEDGFYDAPCEVTYVSSYDRSSYHYVVQSAKGATRRVWESEVEKLDNRQYQESGEEANERK